MTLFPAPFVALLLALSIVLFTAPFVTFFSYLYWQIIGQIGGFYGIIKIV